MRKHPHSQSGRSSPRIFAAIGLCLVGAWLAMLSLAAPTSGVSSSAANFRKGEPVVPSEFRGDLRNLPQTITPAQRKRFIRPLELDYPVPAIKQVLPGGSLEAQTLAPTSVGADAGSRPFLRWYELQFQWRRSSTGHRRGRWAESFRSSC